MKLNLILRFFVISMILFSFTLRNSDAYEKPKEVTIADQGPYAPPIEELVSEALEKSPAINAVKDRFAASKELITPASALPDPMLEFTLEENVSSLSSPNFIKGEMMLKQELPFPGKRSTLGKSAGAESEMEFANLVYTNRQITKDVRTIYAELYSIDSELDALKLAQELLKMLEATAAVRYSTGEGDQESQIKAQLELSRLLEKMTDITAKRKEMSAGLNRLLGRSGNHLIGKVVSLPVVSLTQEQLEKPEQLAFTNSPSVLLRTYAVKAAKYRVESADLDFWPDFFVGAGIGYDNNYEPMGLLSFGITLPLWQNVKQKPLKRAATLKVDESAKLLEEAKLAASSEITNLIARWNRDQKQIVIYKDAIIPQTSAALNSARASYLSGRADFSVVIEDYNLWLDARTQLARREADRYVTWAGFDALTAPLPSNDKQGQKP
ncbi:MAG: TolC family protein [Desulfobacterium sp.]|nr:TolC family protein [Desulfobacterium sp.]MBU3949073.1 TolC family protein [Pseudomonadota bacterium]MBU4035839.1 TolC family protein [Pseudomonadota bacterium]